MLDIGPMIRRWVSLYLRWRVWFCCDVQRRVIGTEIEDLEMSMSDQEFDQAMRLQRQLVRYEIHAHELYPWRLP